MADLDLVPTDDLLKALKRRFDHMVFASIKDMGANQGEDYFPFAGRVHVEPEGPEHGEAPPARVRLHRVAKRETIRGRKRERPARCRFQRGAVVDVTRRAEPL